MRLRISLLLLLLTSVGPLWAATPNSGTITDVSPSVPWSGGPFTAVIADTALCTSLTCDTFSLTVNLPADFYTVNPDQSVHVKLSWDSNVNDFDLYVFDASGNLVGSSASGSTSEEFAECGQLANGNYQVLVVPFATVNSTYSGTAEVGLTPQGPNRKARYKTGRFTFSAPLKLERPDDAANTTVDLVRDQDVEPRVVHDALGNIYAAAIQGVPGGVDVWKSIDGGQSFTYLGQPDGAQAAAALGATGAGLGGGDEDLAVGTTGNVYLSSLYLGSATQCTSFNGGSTWVVNPLSTDVPGDDRQWIAAHGENELYLTYKQLGVLAASTPSILVVKSFDGGLTFPQVAQVTTPITGVQPGLQGNIEVDPATGNVYNVFVGANANELYLARSTNGGQSFIVKLIVRADEGVALGHVFPAIAIDKAGNLHVVYSEGHSVFLLSSSDQGLTWTKPVRVNNGGDTRTSIAPWVSAGQSGRVNVSWWGTSAANFLDTNADWKVMFAQTQNAFANVPEFSQSAATGIMHHGPICVTGLSCPSGTRTLAEYFAIDTYTDGRALLVYPDDKNSGTSTGSARTFFVRQTGGPTVLGK